MLVSWSWEWASCTIFSRAVVDGILADTIDSVVRNEIPGNFMCLSTHDIEYTAKQKPGEDSGNNIELF